MLNKCLPWAVHFPFWWVSPHLHQLSIFSGLWFIAWILLFPCSSPICFMQLIDASWLLQMLSTSCIDISFLLSSCFCRSEYLVPIIIWSIIHSSVSQMSLNLHFCTWNLHLARKSSIFSVSFLFATQTFVCGSICSKNFRQITAGLSLSMSCNILNPLFLIVTEFCLLVCFLLCPLRSTSCTVVGKIWKIPPNLMFPSTSMVHSYH